MPLDSLRYSSPPDAPMPEAYTGVLDTGESAPGSTVVEIGEDGGVKVKQIGMQPRERDADDFDENLAELPELETALSEIATEILDGVEADILSRAPFIENFTRGVDLLGLVIETQARTKGQKRKTSTARDTTLLESVVKAQSAARAELLPAEGPAKVQVMPEASDDDERLANDWESDFNYILTKGMPEWVPGFDKGMFTYHFGGNLFRYGYHCPFLGRPRVESVGAEDLIVSQDATDLETATRVTMRSITPPNEVKRRQKFGQWRDCDLGMPQYDTDLVRQKKNEISGQTPGYGARPQDMSFEFYSTITDLDLRDYGLTEKGQPDLPLPYRVVVEKHSRQIVEIKRFWKKDDPLFMRKSRIKHYSMVPGFGLLGYGFLHLQGNQVSTLTAVIRMLTDALMFGNFPGGVKTKGIRTETNEINPGPGEFAEINVPAGVDDIRKAIMALPYKDVSAVSIQFYELVQQACARIGSSAMLEVGEGRAQMPVGTIMAMLEEKSVVMAAVHKRTHESLTKELEMIRELFAEKPESLERVLPNPRRDWAGTEFADLNLVPQSDPNIPSRVHRLILATAMATLLTMPGVAQLMDVPLCLKDILRMIGVADVDRKVVGQPPSGADPAQTAADASLKAKQMDIASKAQDNQRKAAADVVKAQQQERDSQRSAAVDMAKIQADREKDQAGLQMEHMRMATEEARQRRQESHEAQQAAMQRQHESQQQAGQQAHETQQANNQVLQGLQHEANYREEHQPQPQGPRSFGGQSI